MLVCTGSGALLSEPDRDRKVGMLFCGLTAVAASCDDTMFSAAPTVRQGHSTVTLDFP